MIFDGVELPSLVTVDQAALVLGVDVATILRWIEEGLLDAARANGRIRVLTSSIADRKGLKTPSRPNFELQG
jgi:excisionase family DNA binding protein